MVLEKEQVALLAEKLVELIDEAAHTTGASTDLEPDSADLDPLETPLTEAFRVGAFGSGPQQQPHCSLSPPRKQRSRQGHRSCYVWCRLRGAGQRRIGKGGLLRFGNPFISIG